MGTFRFPDRARVLRNLLISLESDELGVDVRLGGMLNRATPHTKKTTQRQNDCPSDKEDLRTAMLLSPSIYTHIPSPTYVVVHKLVGS